MASPSGPSTRRGAWRLADAPSAYLRGAAEQPIEWHPWGEEAFALAKRTGRPVLLDIGASWCHWCHVMDEGTYSDDEVARLLQQHFVAVKVDRDQRPEVDRRYQRQIGTLTGEGGWPLTAFLTPDGEAFFGGTYFPPADGLGRPGFRRVLKEIARVWREEPDQVRQNTRAVRESLKRLGAVRSGPAASAGAFCANVRDEVLSAFDPVHGGFGNAPKFPHPTALRLLLWDSFARRTDTSADRARETLARMAEGGIYDQVGGGFHRYSVDEGWHIPHFEKMAVDNAALIDAYVEGTQRFAEARFEEVLRGSLHWVRKTLQAPDGGFGASQDADNAPGDDGGYYTWTRAELGEVLDSAELRLASRVFGVGTDGRMPHDPERNVLFRLLSLADAAEGLDLPDGPGLTLDRALGKLAEARARRPAPAVDPALYADLNGRMIGAFARAGSVLGDPTALADARRAADRLLRDGFRPGEGVAHSLLPGGPRGFGLLEDQVGAAHGLLELAVASADSVYLARAIELLELVDREFRGEDGLLRDIAPRLYDGPAAGGVSEPAYPLEDSPHLSANAGAALAWLRLFTVLHEERWREKARALLVPIGNRIGGTGLFAAGAALAAGLLDTAPATVVVEGSGGEAARLVSAARRSWHPNVAVFEGHPPEPFSLPEELTSGAERSEARALVCFGTSCAPPVTDPDRLRALLAAGRPEGTT